MKIRKIVWFIVILASVFWGLPENLIIASFSISDLMYTLAFIIVLSEKIITKKKFVLFFNSPYGIVLYILLFLGIGAMTGVMNSPDSFGASAAFLQYLFIFIVMLTVIEYLINNNYKNSIYILVLFTLPGVISSAVVVLSALGIIQIFDDQLLYGLGRYRGFNGKLPTAFGIQMVLTSIIIYMIIKVNKKFKIKIFWFILLLISIYSIILTASFGSIFILSISFFLIFWINSKENTVRRLLLILLVVVSIFVFYLQKSGSLNVFVYLPDIFETRINYANGELGSVDVRNELNLLGIEQFLQNPLFGIGHTQFVNYNPYGRVVHNTIISAAVESGMFGLIGVIMYLVIPLVWCNRLLRLSYFNNNQFEKIMINYLFIYLITRLLQTTVAHEYIERELWIPGLVLIVTYANKTRLIKANKKAELRNSLREGRP